MKPLVSRYFAAISASVLLGSFLSPTGVNAAPLELAPTSVPGNFYSYFMDPSGMGVYYTTINTFEGITAAAPIVQGDVTGYVSWEVRGDGVFNYTYNPAYFAGQLSLGVTYRGNIAADGGVRPTLGAVSITFFDLEGITAEELLASGAGNRTNSASFLGLSYNFDSLPTKSFSFSGFRISAEIPNGGPYTANLTSFASATIYATSQSYATTSPGAFFTYQAVPEPSSVVLLVGAAGIGLLGLRRRRDAAKR